LVDGLEMCDMMLLTSYWCVDTLAFDLNVYLLQSKSVKFVFMDINRLGPSLLVGRGEQPDKM
jgi:hypothetical protein